MIEFDKTLIEKPINIINGEKFISYFDSKINNNEESRISLNGKWKIFHGDEVNLNVLENNFDDSDLKEIILPNNLELLGYSLPQYTNRMYPFEGLENLKIGEVPINNEVTIFRRNFEISSLNYDYFIEFNGFISCVYLYINGNFVGFSSLNYEVSRFNINKYINLGNNSISIILYKYSFATWYNDQDLFRLTGIFRDINLVKLNKVHFLDINNKSILLKDYKTGKLDVDIFVDEYHENLKLKLTLINKNKQVIQETIVLKDIFYNLNKEIKNVLKWSDEEPNLYNLKLELFNNKNLLETTFINIGFRVIEIKDGVIYLNNNRLILKGINRHEFSINTGRVMNKELVEQDLKLLKANNFNAIRCSHYPNVNYFYDLCDELGLIVMDEASIETHGTWDKIEQYKDKNFEYKVLPGSDKKYKDFTVNRVLAMYERDKNHPSILFWSLGNESYGGKNLEESYYKLKEKDKSRIISYEGVYKTPKYAHISDVVSRMYFKPNDVIKYLNKHTEKPFIQIEFAHSMGNSTGNFDEYMDLCNRFKNYQGGFIWDYVDQGLLINNKICYGGDNYDYPNDNNFCANGLLLAKRNKTAKLKIVKYFYQSLRFEFQDNKVIIFNDNYYKNTAKIKFIYEILKEGEVIFTKSFESNVLPRTNKEIDILPNINFDNDIDYLVRIRALAKEDNNYLKQNDEIAFEEKFIKGDLFTSFYKEKVYSNNKIITYKSLNHLTVEVNKLKVIFNGIENNLGGLEAIYYDNKQYLMKLILPTLFRANIDNDRIINKFFTSFYFSSSFFPLYNPMKNEIKIIKETNNYVIIRVIYKMINAIFFTNFIIDYKITNSEEIIVEAKYKTNKLLPPPDFIGLRIPIKNKFSEFKYLGLGKEDNYIDRYKGIKYGIYESNCNDEYIPYSIPQDSGNHLGTKYIKIPMNDHYLNFYSLDKSFEFKFIPYSEFELEIKERNEELVKSKFNYLTIALANRGVGGDDSWGAPTHSKYCLKKNKLYSLKFKIFID